MNQQLKNISIDTSIYGQIALSQAYRILGLGDRESDSPTYGCFDRYYWHYRQTDFVNARFQEAGHFLSLLYLYNHPDNRFYQKTTIYDWAAAAVQYWTKIQCPDGSFNEYWPFERSFCVTSFTLYAAAESCRRLNCSIPETAIRKAAQWLAHHDNPLVLNQMAASAVALHLSGEILQDNTFLNAAARRIEQIIALQDPTGYFPEYGGYDIGYQTISLSCLSKYQELCRDQRLSESLEKGFRFLEDKILSNGTFDYRSTSRKTQYIYPFGLCAGKQWDLLSRHIRGLEQNEVLHPGWCDDRYCLPLAIDYLQTVLVDKSPEHPNSKIMNAI